MRHRVGWRCDDGGDEAVFQPVKIRFDGIGRVPWGPKEGIVGLFFRWCWTAVERAEDEQDSPRIVVVAVGAGAHDCSGSNCAALELFWHCNVQGIDDGLRNVQLGEIFHFVCIVDGFGVAGELCIEADAVVRARINRVSQRGSRFHGVLRGLLGEASIAPLVQLGGLDCLELGKEIALKGTNVAVVRPGMKGRQWPDHFCCHG